MADAVVPPRAAVRRGTAPRLADSPEADVGEPSRGPEGGGVDVATAPLRVPP